MPVLVPLLSLLLGAAAPELPAGYADEMRLWRVDRARRLNAEDGWPTLAGLHWLKDGSFKVGSDPASALVLPESAPPRVGTFHVKNNHVRFEPERGVEVRKDGVPYPGGELKSDEQGTPDVLEVGFIRLQIIKRAGKLALRVRDVKLAARMITQDILTYFPVTSEWRKVARWEPAKEPRTLKVQNVVGFTEEMPCPGTAVFTVDGKEYRLEAAQEKGSPELFIIFADETNKDATYPSGRFLSAPAPQDGAVVLDFNKAYSPPCAFTRFATCPLPPAQNRLPVRVEAGERYLGAKP